jgi:hypothetical protein
VKLAKKYGLHRTAKVLRVNYYALKKRVEGEAASDVRGVPEGGSATFLELAGVPCVSSKLAGSCEYTLELEDGDGAKMRVHLSGVAAPDLVALSRSF